ncbi:MAG: ATP-binding protein, partial [Bacteroidales bacterium]|nr:ATP-binding protein [Bacteroidales bacterium]
VAILGPRQVGKTTLVKKLRGELTRESVYVVPQNHTIYSISENQYVATPWQILKALKS